MKRKLLIGVIISGIFLFLALRDIDWAAFADVFSDVNYWYLIPAVVFTMLGHFTRSYRWKFMLNNVKRVSLGNLWSATAIAFMFNNLFPARLGEFVRAYAIGKSDSISKSAAFATIVYERIVDVFMLIFLLWFCLLKIEGPDWLQRSGIILVLFNMTLLVLLFVMLRYRERFNALVRALSKPLPARFRDRLQHIVYSFVDGLGVLRDRSALLPIAFLSLFVWGFATLGVYCCFFALDLQLSFLASVVLIVLISLGSMIPSAPAYIGTLQYACIIGLGIYGVEKSEALAYSTLYHATQFFPITIAGLYYAWKSQIRLADVSDDSK